ncbi:MAG: hypothetical protein QE485_06495 [Acidovorax sp.]|uniref:hypothetical protein n=1 Tax=Acidovorax sp. TaxID=1872122 RepID=UPI0026128654|nr:hypothetical protein [Acidovorax sp.]MDH4416855.1 hypothetical protein [Acidovorax sp.]
MRSQLANTYKVRGHSTGKIWLQYSAKACRDIAFASEIDYLHFLYVESSFDVVSVDYTPELKVQRAVGSSFVKYINAEIVTTHGDAVWRHVCEANKVESARYRQRQLQTLLQSFDMPDGAQTPRVEILTHEDMLAAPHRIRNWHSVAAWLAAGRDWALTEEQLEVAALIRSKKRVEFQEVLGLGKGTDHDDLYGVAIFRSMQAGAYSSNLFDTPFSMSTFFSEKQGSV